MVASKELHYLQNKVYDEGVTLITLTGDRQLAFSRCEFYVERMLINVKNKELSVQWLVIDDGKIATVTSNRYEDFLQYIRREPSHKKIKSFLNNLQAALPLIKYNKILIIEDDDWYHPGYIQIYIDRLQNYDLVGEGPAHYYNIRHHSYRKVANTKRASFCQTGFNSCVIEKLFVSSMKQSSFVDARLWSKDCKKFIWQDKPHCIGMKSLPGRPGIGIGHRPNKYFIKDPDFKKLIKWVGKEDAQWYIGLKF